MAGSYALPFAMRTSRTLKRLCESKRGLVKYLIYNVDCSVHLARVGFAGIFGSSKTKGSCCFGFICSFLYIAKTFGVELVYEWVYNETAMPHCQPVGSKMASVMVKAVRGNWTSRVLYGALL